MAETQPGRVNLTSDQDTNVGGDVVARDKFIAVKHINLSLTGFQGVAQ